MRRLPPITPYRYPDHLRDQLAHLPHGPGVYLFYGDQHTFPLYIGKSINIRTRVLAHLRTHQEARLLQQARHIRHHCTAGNLGAQLLEAQLIKQLHPLHNRRLRKQRRLYCLRWQDDAPQIIAASPDTLTTQGPTFGLFASRQAAVSALTAIADTHGLCYQRLGLTTWPIRTHCFRVALGRCRGVCCGQESHHAHDLRLRDAIARWRIQAWPYPGAIGLIEQSPQQRQIHVVDHWYYLGSARDRRQARRLIAPVPEFDRDMYHILCRPIVSQAYPIMTLPCSH